MSDTGSDDGPPPGWAPPPVPGPGGTSPYGDPYPSGGPGAAQPPPSAYPPQGTPPAPPPGGGYGAPGGYPPGPTYPPGTTPPGAGYAPSGYTPYTTYGYGGSTEHPQGTTILVLGILSIVVCGLLGPVAWVMGNNALREIDAAPGRYSNRSTVQAGRIMGIVVSGLMALGFAIIIVAIIAAAASESSGY